MLKIEIHDFKAIHAEHLVLDFNGTLAIDGLFIEDVVGKLVQVSAILQVHVLTADTFSTVQEELKGLPFTIQVLDIEGQDK